MCWVPHVAGTTLRRMLRAWDIFVLTLPDLAFVHVQIGYARGTKSAPRAGRVIILSCPLLTSYIALKVQDVRYAGHAQ